MLFRSIFTNRIWLTGFLLTQMESRFTVSQYDIVQLICFQLFIYYISLYCFMFLRVTHPIIFITSMTMYIVSIWFCTVFITDWVSFCFSQLIPFPILLAFNVRYCMGVDDNNKDMLLMQHLCFGIYLIIIVATGESMFFMSLMETIFGVLCCVNAILPAREVPEFNKGRDDMLIKGLYAVCDVVSPIINILFFVYTPVRTRWMNEMQLDMLLFGAGFAVGPLWLWIVRMEDMLFFSSLVNSVMITVWQGREVNPPMSNEFMGVFCFMGGFCLCIQQIMLYRRHKIQVMCCIFAPLTMFLIAYPISWVWPVASIIHTSLCLVIVLIK